MTDDRPLFATLKIWEVFDSLMTRLQVRNTEKFELQRELYQDQKKIVWFMRLVELQRLELCKAKY